MREGVVTLNGQVENEDVAADTVRLARALAAVVEVVEVVDELRLPGAYPMSRK